MPSVLRDWKRIHGKTLLKKRKEGKEEFLDCKVCWYVDLFLHGKNQIVLRVALVIFQSY